MQADCVVRKTYKLINLGKIRGCLVKCHIVMQQCCLPVALLHCCRVSCSLNNSHGETTDGQLKIYCNFRRNTSMLHCIASQKSLTKRILSNLNRHA